MACGSSFGRIVAFLLFICVLVNAAQYQTRDVDVKPVTKALIGSRTFNVTTDTELSNVPWPTLTAGDVINVFYRATPYKVKLCLRVRATAASPVIINGVTDANGNRPIIDGNGAKTAATCSGFFSSTPAYGESLGLIVIMRGQGDPYEYQPAFIKINNLQITGARNGNSYTSNANAVVPYSSSAGIYFHVGEDFSVTNCVINDNGFGIFTMAKYETLEHTVKRFNVTMCRVYGNGVDNSFFEHNFYVQTDSPIIDGNYIGSTRPLSEGSSFKDRSARLVFRNNYVVGSARAIDMVHAEEQSEGTSALPYYGYDYVYNNYIYNEPAPMAIHYGGDNGGEQESGDPVYVPPVPYRKHLFFWNNVVVHNTSFYYISSFDLSLVPTTADVWNNTFYFLGSTVERAWLEQAGQLHLGIDNKLIGESVDKSGLIGRSNPQHYNVTDFSGPPSDPYLAFLMGLPTPSSTSSQSASTTANSATTTSKSASSTTTAAAATTSTTTTAKATSTTTSQSTPTPTPQTTTTTAKAASTTTGSQPTPTPSTTAKSASTTTAAAATTTTAKSATTTTASATTAAATTTAKSASTSTSSTPAPATTIGNTTAPPTIGSQSTTSGDSFPTTGALPSSDEVSSARTILASWILLVLVFAAIVNY